MATRVTRNDAHRFYRREGYALNKTSHFFEKPLHGLIALTPERPRPAYPSILGPAVATKPLTTVLDRISESAQLRSLSDAELEQLAAELREKMIRTVQQTGGHLASLAGRGRDRARAAPDHELARDRIVWDTGHQAYAHKLLTGRRRASRTLRQVGGVGGFPRRSESDHDVFDGGHAGTGVSIAVGLAAARDLLPPGDPRTRASASPSAWATRPWPAA